MNSAYLFSDFKKILPETLQAIQNYRDGWSVFKCSSPTAIHRLNSRTFQLWGQLNSSLSTCSFNKRADRISIQKYVRQLMW